MDEKERTIKLIIFAIIIPVIIHLVFCLVEKWHYDYGWFEGYTRKKFYILEGVICCFFLIYADRFDFFSSHGLRRGISPVGGVAFAIMLIIDKFLRPNYDNNEFNDGDTIKKNSTGLTKLALIAIIVNVIIAGILYIPKII